MAIYALGITPLIMTNPVLVTKICDNMKMVIFVDDFSVAGKLKSLLQLWTTLLEMKSYEPIKLWLITKFETHALGKEIFKNTKSNITNSGKR